MPIWPVFSQEKMRSFHPVAGILKAQSKPIGVLNPFCQVSAQFASFPRQFGPMSSDATDAISGCQNKY
jgi:hypothetical protein